VLEHIFLLLVDRSLNRPERVSTFFFFYFLLFVCYVRIGGGRPLSSFDFQLLLYYLPPPPHGISNTKASFFFFFFFSFLIWEKGQQPGRCFPFCKDRSLSLSFAHVYRYIYAQKNLPSLLGIVVRRLRHPFVMCVVFPPSYFISPSIPPPLVTVSALISLSQTHTRLPTNVHKRPSRSSTMLFSSFSLSLVLLLIGFFLFSLFFFYYYVFFYCCSRRIKYIGGGISTPETKGEKHHVSSFHSIPRKCITEQENMVQ
jgi:hypothetical protein